MKKRFFTKGKNAKLFVLFIDDVKKEMYEYVLTEDGLEETSDLMKIMIDGFQGIEEISEQKASEIYKDKGFKKAMNSLGK
jgi:hypothetical protein